MNREIKFRGKLVDNGEWVRGDLYRYQGKVFISYEIIEHPTHSDPAGTWIYKEYEVIPETVGQYTGLKDKSGKEIYEGDIVNQEKWVSVGKYVHSIGIIKYKCVEFTCECIGDWLGSNANLNGNAEIIGNLHDNPELIN